MGKFLIENWKNISLMIMLFMILTYSIMKGNTEFIAGTILPMIAIGLNLNQNKKEI